MTKYKYFKSKNYRSNVNLVVESDIVEVSDQTSEGGTTPTLQEVTDEGAVTTNAISVPELKLYDESNDDYSYIKVNDNTLFFYNASGEIVYSFAFGSNSINFDVGDITSNRNYSLPDAIGKLQLSPIRVVGSITALNGATYYNESTATYTDPPPLSGQGFIVIVGGGTATIGGVGYTSGNLIYRFYQGGAWSSTVFVSQNKISQILRFLDNESTFEFTQTSDFKINSVVEQSGTEAIIKLSDGTTDYTLGDTVDAFDYLIISVDVAGTIELIGEKL
jgi:hypothetical protein